MGKGRIEFFYDESAYRKRLEELQGVPARTQDMQERKARKLRKTRRKKQ